MNLHKFVRQAIELSSNDIDTLDSIFSIIRTARQEFINVGVEFTYERFKEYFERAYKDDLANSKSTYYKNLKKIIDGDNLDKIEDVAIDKGLLPKE